MPAIELLVGYLGRAHLLPVPPSTTMAELRTGLATLLTLSQPFHIRYEDGDHDIITMTEDHELTAFLEHAKERGQQHPTLSVHPINQEQPNEVSPLPPIFKEEEEGSEEADSGFEMVEKADAQSQPASPASPARQEEEEINSQEDSRKEEEVEEHTTPSLVQQVVQKLEEAVKEGATVEEERKATPPPTSSALPSPDPPVSTEQVMCGLSFTPTISFKVGKKAEVQISDPLRPSRVFYSSPSLPIIHPATPPPPAVPAPVARPIPQPPRPAFILLPVLLCLIEHLRGKLRRLTTRRWRVMKKSFRWLLVLAVLWMAWSAYKGVSSTKGLASKGLDKDSYRQYNEVVASDKRQWERIRAQEERIKGLLESEEWRGEELAELRQRTVQLEAQMSSLEDIYFSARRERQAEVIALTSQVTALQDELRLLKSAHETASKQASRDEVMEDGPQRKHKSCERTGKWKHDRAEPHKIKPTPQPPAFSSWEERKESRKTAREERAERREREKENHQKEAQKADKASHDSIFRLDVLDEIEELYNPSIAYSYAGPDGAHAHAGQSRSSSHAHKGKEKDDWKGWMDKVHDDVERGRERVEEGMKLHQHHVSKVGKNIGKAVQQVNAAAKRVWKAWGKMF